MDEAFDFLNNPLHVIEDVVYEIEDIDFLEILVDVEKDGQDRKMFYDMVDKRIQMLRLKFYGFDINLLDRLLNSPPFYRYGVVKERIPPDVLEKVYERDEGRCRLCFSKNDLVCHHIDPQGPATMDNLVILCHSCHIAIHRFLSAKGYTFYIPQRGGW